MHGCFWGFRVWASAGSFKDIQWLIPKPLQHCLGCKLRVVVVLNNKPPAFLQGFVFGWIHSSLITDKCPHAWCREAPPQCDAATTLLSCRNGVGQAMSSTQYLFSKATTSLTATLLAWLQSVAGWPALGRVLVVPYSFHFTMVEPTVLYTQIYAATPIDQRVPWTSWCGFLSEKPCELWDLIYTHRCVPF